MDHSYSSYRDGQYVEVPPIDKLCLSLKDKFLRQEEENQKLREENKYLKSEHYKDETIAKLKEELDQVTKDLYRGFGISKEEYEKIREWKKSHSKVNTGAIGGRYEYRFFPTGIGTSGKIIDLITKEEFTFCELG